MFCSGAGKERFRDGFFDEFLDIFADEPGTMFGDEAFLREEGDDGGRYGKRGATFGETLLERGEFEPDDLRDRVGTERVEDDRFVDAGEKFGSEGFLEFFERGMLC